MLNHVLLAIRSWHVVFRPLEASTLYPVATLRLAPASTDPEAVPMPTSKTGHHDDTVSYGEQASKVAGRELRTCCPCTARSGSPCGMCGNLGSSACGRRPTLGARPQANRMWHGADTILCAVRPAQRAWIELQGGWPA